MENWLPNTEVDLHLLKRIDRSVELGSNRVTIRVNNLLDHSTLPVGNLKTWEDEDGNIYYKVDENFDFFNYTGIHRPVKTLYYSKQWIRDLSLVSEVSGADAVVK